MNYDSLSNEELHQLIWLRVPEVAIRDVDGSNRCTVIAFLKLSDSSADDMEKKKDNAPKAPF